MTLIFPRVEIDKLLAHSLKALRHRAVYDQKETKKPGLWLVKDEGVYLMSNGEPSLEDEKTGSHAVVYADGHGPREEHMGGDDWVEYLPATTFTNLVPTARVIVTVTDSEIKVEAV